MKNECIQHNTALVHWLSSSEMWDQTTFSFSFFTDEYDSAAIPLLHAVCNVMHCEAIAGLEHCAAIIGGWGQQGGWG